MANERQIILSLLYLIHKKINLLRIVLPSFFIKCLFNYLSKKYTIAFTEIISDSKDDNHIKQTLWNDTINDIIYFPPVQSNTSKYTYIHIHIL